MYLYLSFNHRLYILSLVQNWQVPRMSAAENVPSMIVFNAHAIYGPANM
jgi:hypothetical protein